jgi:hypothetical protein
MVKKLQSCSMMTAFDGATLIEPTVFDVSLVGAKLLNFKTNCRADKRSVIGHYG